jgi:ankyrin repeat protein
VPDVNWKLEHMVQPPALRSEEYQLWSRGRGVDVWAMLRASIAGDLVTVKRLLDDDSGLVNCEYEYFKPIRFAVRENHRDLAAFLFEKGADPAFNAGDSLSTIARDRGFVELAEYIEGILKERHHVVPEAKQVVEAIKARDIDRVRELIDKQPDLVHAADEYGSQPVHWAVMTRQIALIDYLLERGADINSPRPGNARPIHLTNGDYHYRGWRDLPPTAIQRHEVLIGYLLSKGAYYDISTATRLGDMERVRQLLDENASLVNEVPGVSYYNGAPLKNAAAAGHRDLVRFLLERAADPNLPEPEIAPQGAALHAAIQGKHYEIVKLLLEHGANPNAAVESSGNCMSMAKWSGAPKEIIDLIASYGGVRTPELVCHDNDLETLAQMLSANPDLPLQEQFGNPEMMKLILHYQPDLLRRSPDLTPWWSLATPKNPEFAKWLMERGLDPNRRNWLGITLLHRCAAKGEIETAQVCMDFGADINVVETDSSSTPLGCAARTGKKEMVEWLLEKGADASAPQDEPWARPIEWAKRRGHQEIVHVLQQA